jgi:membrane protein DedA with SNARE-associated domain
LAVMSDINQLITDWGYAGIFFVVILGNIGLPVPEETVLAVAGYLVWSGRLQLLPVLVVALVSAVAGDNLGYWLGRHYGRAVVDRYARWLLKPGRLMVAESFVSRYGALAVCVARFVGGCAAALRITTTPSAWTLDSADRRGDRLACTRHPQRGGTRRDPPRARRGA